MADMRDLSHPLAIAGTAIAQLPPTTPPRKRAPKCAHLRGEGGRLERSPARERAEAVDEARRVAEHYRRAL
eukprot:gene15338-biopygen13505